MNIDDLNKFAPNGLHYELSGVNSMGEIVNDERHKTIKVVIEGAQNSPYYGGGLIFNLCLDTLECIAKGSQCSSLVDFETYLNKISIIKTESSRSRNSQIIRLIKLAPAPFQNEIDKAIRHFNVMNNYAILKDRAFGDIHNQEAVLRCYKAIVRESFGRETCYGINKQLCEKIIANTLQKIEPRHLAFKPEGSWFSKIFHAQKTKRRNEFVKNAVQEFNQKLKMISAYPGSLPEFAHKILDESTQSELESRYIEARQKFDNSWKAYADAVYPSNSAGIFDQAIIQSAINWVEAQITAQATV